MTISRAVVSRISNALITLDTGEYALKRSKPHCALLNRVKIGLWIGIYALILIIIDSSRKSSIWSQINDINRTRNKNICSYIFIKKHS